MRIRNLLLAAATVALPLAAQAQPVTGLYIGGGAGVNIMQDEPVTSVGGLSVTGVNLQTNIGAAAVLSLGWGFGNGLRAEIEGDYRYNGLSKLSGGGASVSLGGSEQKFGPMVNVLYDFTTLSPVVVPYVGVGAGYQWADLTINSVAGFSTTSSSKTVGAFAYQAILGAAFPIAPVPGLAVTAEYRFLGLAGDRNYSGVKLGNDFNHAIMVGLRYAFGVAPAPAPAPAPMAAPAPAPARSYLVFFDWDKATLTPRAQQIIHEAADNSTKVKYTAIEVNGYTDTSGTPQYNQGLSIRRAQAVAAELVKDGVPKGAISIQGFGETHLLVPTGPGVREPQNRRVEIIIR
jgi:outer membrane protein OmpA-like peptidoglycan-associated protein